MNYDPKIHHRRSIRLKGYDYTREGFYFITICTQNRINLFGEIIEGKMNLNEAAQMVRENYYDLEIRFPNIKCNEFIIMPNHFHCIIQINAFNATVGSGLVPDLKGQPPQKVQPIETKKGQPQGIAPTKESPTIGNIIGAFKSLTTNAYISGVRNYKWKPFNKRFWERNYYEHIIRNEKSFNNISNYIKQNPEKWEDDKYYENNIRENI